MDSDRYRRVREAAMERERENRADRVQRILAEARRHIANKDGAAPSGIKYSQPIETPSPSLIFK